MDSSKWEPYFPMVTDICLEAAAGGRRPELLDLLTRMMDLNGLPMHCPVHHYMVPAALLTVCRGLRGYGVEILERDLATSLERARNVLPGFCGFYGTCGAAVGVGIFWSVITDSTPYSPASWPHLNRATGQALLEIAELGGPRCCKRTVFSAVKSTIPQIRELLGLEIALPAEIVCQYHKQNAECRKQGCPYYPTVEMEAAG